MCVNAFSRVSPSNIFKNKQTITCYKVISLDKGKFYTSFRKVPFPTHGIFKAHSIYESYLDITYGIHVFLSKEIARRHAYSYEYIVPVLCERKHFIIADYEQAAFTQVRIHKRAKIKCIKL